MLIQQLRDGTQGILTKIIVGLIIIAFGLFGFGSITTFLVPLPKVATVNGEDISQQEMEVAVERDRQLRLSQDAAATIDEDELRENALDRLINRELLQQQVASLGLQVSEAMLNQEILDNEAFHIEGKFDADQYRLVLGRAGYTPLSFQDDIRDDKLISQLASGIGGSQFVTPEEAARLNNVFRHSRDIAFLQFAAEPLEEEVTVADEELQEYYDEHLDDFVTDETVSLAYLEVVLSELADAIEVSDDELLEEYESVKEQYTTEEQREISHILVEISDEVTEEQAKEKIDEIHAEVLAGGDFAELAKEHSDDTVSAEQGGELGLSGKGIFVKPFEDVAFAQEVGEISEPVLTQFGYHIITVTGIEEASIPELDEIRVEVGQAYRDRLAREDFTSLSAELGELAFEHPDLTIPAEELGLEIQTAEAMTREEETGVMSHAEVVEAVFDPDVLVDGNNTDVIELNGERLLVLRVTEHSPSEQRPLEDVTEEVRARLKTQGAVALAAEKAAAALEQLNAGATAEEVAEQNELEWATHDDVQRNALTPDSAIVEAAFELQRPAGGEESLTQVELSNGDAVVVRVVAVHDREASEAEEEEAVEVFSGQFGNTDFFDFRRSLRELAEVALE